MSLHEIVNVVIIVFLLCHPVDEIVFALGGRQLTIVVVCGRIERADEIDFAVDRK